MDIISGAVENFGLSKWQARSAAGIVLLHVYRHASSGVIDLLEEFIPNIYELMREAPEASPVFNGVLASIASSLTFVGPSEQRLRSVEVSFVRAGIDVHFAPAMIKLLSRYIEEKIGGSMARKVEGMFFKSKRGADVHKAA